MTFRLHIKGAGNKALAATEIRICKTSISFGAEISEELNKLGYCEVWFDKENNRVGFKPTKNRVTGFHTPHRTNSKCLFISNSIVARRVTQGSYVAKYDQGFWVINVSEIAEK